MKFDHSHAYLYMPEIKIAAERLYESYNKLTTILPYYCGLISRKRVMEDLIYLCNIDMNGTIEYNNPYNNPYEEEIYKVLHQCLLDAKFVYLKSTEQYQYGVHKY